MEKEVYIWSVGIFKFLQVLLQSTTDYALPLHGASPSSLAGCLPVLLCPFTASSRTTPRRYMVPTTCRVTINLWSMPLVCPSRGPLFRCYTVPLRHISLHVVGLQYNPHDDSTAGSRTAHNVHQNLHHGTQLLLLLPHGVLACATLYVDASRGCTLFSFCAALLYCHTLLHSTSQVLSTYALRTIVRIFVFLPAYTKGCCRRDLHAVCRIIILFGRCWDLHQCPRFGIPFYCWQ